jgi:predicted DNA-binding protein with PD1-like motif
MAAQRSILHPGPLGAQRVDAVPVALHRVDLLLQPGQPLLQALVAALPAGTRSAVLTLGSGALFPLAYVMPALAKTAEHAVYFSDRFDAAAPVQLHEASVTFGQRDGQPWLHCHARWVAADGTPHCGHLLPDEAVLASPLPATAWLLNGAAFEVVPDAETRFTLFRPVADEPARSTAGPAVAVRLAPNEDVCTALETVCRQQGWRGATVRGGVGSTVGAVFDDGRTVEPFVTEVLIRQGRVQPEADGTLQADIDVSLVDYTGGLASGRLARGANPVLVTFELVLEAD